MNQPSIRCKVCSEGELTLVSARVHAPAIVAFGFLWVTLSALFLATTLIMAIGLIFGAIRLPNQYDISIETCLFLAISPVGFLICGTIGAFCIGTKEVLRCRVCHACTEVCGESRYVPAIESITDDRDQLELDTRELIERELAQHATKTT